MERFWTELGAQVTVLRAPEHLGDGPLMRLAVPHQGQVAEVYLSRSDAAKLAAALAPFAKEA